MKNRVSAISRGALSKKTGVNSETIRYYEKINLIPTPARTTNGYRLYDDTHVKRLSFIKRCRELGFALKQVTALLDLVDGDDYTCAEIRDHTIRHLRDVENRILDLNKMRQTLENMVSECEGGLVPDCAIVDALSS
jgi:MerR family mercuric resistance operon transcriptional regulator